MHESVPPEYYEILNDTKPGRKLIWEEWEDEQRERKIKHKEKKKRQRGIIKNRRIK